MKETFPEPSGLSRAHGRYDDGETVTPARTQCRIVACLFFVLMVAAGSLPGKAQALAAVAGDKALHVCAYGTLAAMLYLGMPVRMASRVAGAALALLVLGILGALDEAIQYLLPYRHADLLDWTTNMLAGLLSVAALALINRQRRSRANLDCAPAVQQDGPVEMPHARRIDKHTSKQGKRWRR